MLLSMAQKNEPETIRSLINEKGVPPTHANGIGQTALHVACLWGHVECVKVLVELGANVNASNSFVRATPLHTVLQSGKATAVMNQMEIVDILLKAGADPGLEDLHKSRPVAYVSPDDPNRAILLKKLKPPPRDKQSYKNLFLNDMMGSQSMCNIAPSSKCNIPPPSDK